MSRRKQLCPKPLKVAEGEGPKSAQPMTTYNTQQSLDDDPDFCPLVIDMSSDSANEKTPTTEPISQLAHKKIDLNQSTASHTDLSQSAHSRTDITTETTPGVSQKMPLPISPNNYTATLPNDGSFTDAVIMEDYTRSRCSSMSSSDSHSLHGLSQISPRSSPRPNRPSGKGSAPCKTRRKGDRIMPVGLDDSNGAEKFICPVCSEVLLDATGLTKHIRSHNTSTTASANTCTICGKVLSSQSSLDRHMLVHSGERPFSCRVCKMTFTTNGNMHRHMRIHEKELAGGILPGSGITQNDSAISGSRARKPRRSDVSAGGRFMESSPDGRFISAQSNIYPKSEESLKRKFEGDILSEMPNKRTVPAHRTSSTSPPNTIVRPEVTVPSPVQLTQPKINKDILEKSDSTTWPCSVCDKKFLCTYGLESHMAEHHSELNHVCPQCFVVCNTPQELHNHLRVAHNKTSNSLSSVKKEVGQSSVPVGFQDLDYLAFSSDKFVQVARVWCEKNQQRSSSMAHDFTCERCDHSFPSAAILRLHMDTHAPEKTSTCAVCDCTFVSRAAYKNHMASHASSRVVNNFSKLRGTDDNDLQDCVSKSEFLLVLGLKSKKTKPLRPKTYRDMSMNQVYFDKLSAMSNENGKPKVFPSREITKSSPVNPGSSQRSANFNNVIKGQALLEQLQAPTVPKPVNNHVLPANIPNSKISPFQPLAISTGSIMAPFSYGSDLGRPSIKQEPRSYSHQLLSLTQAHDSLLDDASNHSQDGSTVGDEGDEMHQCKFCNESFSTYRTLKAHERCHLGLSPYQCNLCSYSSTDKSTLVRHLRTHNGARPFQCRLCHFAFTTKANCERHVRNRHGKQHKEEIEASIGYNQQTEDTVQDQEAFASPDTICKYCGEDFKFFRALKHHLRSHSSCRRKPFVCRLCANGFSTKANCIRHVQKQHVDVDQNQIEALIQSNEFQEDSRNLVSDALSNHRDMFLSSTPVAMPTWRFPVPRESPIAHNNKNNMYRRATFINSPPVPDMSSQVKPEPSDSGFDQPLDFSMKTLKEEELAQINDDVPMDLSVSRPAPRKHGLASKPDNSGLFSQMPLPPALLPPQEVSNRTSSAMKLPVVVQHVNTSPTPFCITSHDDLLCHKLHHQYYNSQLGQLQCPFCNILFKHELKLSAHLRCHTDSSLCQFQCGLCAAMFSSRSSVENHLKTQHAQEFPRSFKMVYPMPTTDQGKMTNGQYSSREGQVSPEANNNIKMYNTKPKMAMELKSGNNSAYNSDSELASVTKILDATSAMKFKAYFGDLPSTPPNSSMAPSIQKSQYVSVLANGNPGAQLMIDRDDQDKDRATPDSEVSDGALSLTPSIVDRLTAQEDHMTQHDDMDLLDDEDNRDLDSTKKKRNSYSDSPHKLQCPYCPRAFPWISSLKRHILTHTGQKPFKCPQCPVTFSTKSNRERHMVRKHGLDVHDPATRQMMDRPYKCHLCVFSSFSTSSNLLKHYKDRHPEREMPRQLAATLAAHYAINGTDHLSDAGDSLSSCSEISTRSNAIMNLTNFDEEDEEDVDDLIQDSLSQKLLDHSRNTDISQPQATINTSTSHKVDHIQALDQISHRPISPTPSDLCLTSTPHKMTPPMMHQTGSTPDRHINPERDNYNVDKITDCWKCGAIYQSRKNLLRHLKEHSIDFPFKCYLCDASFDNRIESLEHKMSRHPSDWEIVKEKNKIRNYNEFSMAQERLVQDTLSGKIFKQPDSMEDTKIDTDYAQRKVYCSLCTKRFWSLQDLRRHMRSHTGERPFECDICQARFTLKHSMMRHRRKHCETECGSGASDDETTQHDDTTEQSLPAVNMSAGRVITPHRSGVTLSQSGASREENGGDLLHNLLGVETDALDQMLDSADDAATLLGVGRMAAARK